MYYFLILIFCVCVFFFSRYAIGRRSVRWWLRLFYWLIDVAIVNSFIMKKQKTHGNYDQLAFRLRLAQQMIDGFTNRKRRGAPISLEE